MAVAAEGGCGGGGCGCADQRPPHAVDLCAAHHINKSDTQIFIRNKNTRLIHVRRKRVQ